MQLSVDNCRVKFQSFAFSRVPGDGSDDPPVISKLCTLAATTSLWIGCVKVDMSRLTKFLRLTGSELTSKIRWQAFRLMGPRLPPNFRTVFGKSMPRSGHHFLETMLDRYFGREYRYCEFYRPRDCCHCIPCVRCYDPNQDNRYFMQKSHDFHLRDDPSLNGMYLIQFRSLIPRLQSDFELVVREGWPDRRDMFEQFCIGGTNYSVRFYEKWIKTPAPNRLVISYESLTENTFSSLARAVRFVSGDDQVDAGRIAEIVATSTSNARSTNGGPAIRDPRVFRFYDEDFFRKLETAVLDRCGADSMRFYFISPTNG
jgi:hypothetical protein